MKVWEGVVKVHVRGCWEVRTKPGKILALTAADVELMRRRNFLIEEHFCLNKNLQHYQTVAH